MCLPIGTGSEGWAEWLPRGILEMKRNRKGEVCLRRKCKKCGLAKEPSVDRVCPDCRSRMRAGSTSDHEQGVALVRRLYELRLRASARLPLFP